MQSLRLNRINYEKFHLMDVDTTNKGITFKLCGSSIYMYTITINEYNCNCPDYKNVGQNGILCKHICYILIKILGLSDIEKKIDFSILDINALRQKISVDSVPYQYYRRLKYFKVVDGASACVVCYDNHNNGYECIECKQFLCETCCHAWMTSNNSCPYCRTKLLIPNGSDNYITLFS
jgi:hypothetical protein